MKKLLALLLVLNLSCVAYSQTFKFRTNAAAFAKFNQYTGEWGEYSDFIPTDILVVINSSDKIITIFSATTQQYYVAKLLGTTANNAGGETTSWQCVDLEGSKCIVRIIVYNYTNIAQLYVDYSNVSWFYTLRAT